MTVGVISWQLSFPGCASLKEKRMVLRSLKDRVRGRFNVSVSETDHQDVWTRAELTVAVVGVDRRFVDSVLDKVDRFLEDDGRALIGGTRRSMY